MNIFAKRTGGETPPGSSGNPLSVNDEGTPTILMQKEISAAADLFKTLVRDHSLLAALTVLLFVTPFLDNSLPEQVIGGILFMITFFLGMIALKQHRLAFVIAGILIAISLILEVFTICFPSDFFLALNYARKSFNFFFFACLLFYYLLKKGTFTFSDVSTAVSIFLIIGLSFGFLYCFIDTLHPGSFVYTSPQNEKLPASLLYFSFVDLTTVGCSDIVPVAIITRLVTVAESMFGVFYIAIIIGRLIGIKSSAPGETTSGSH